MGYFPLSIEEASPRARLSSNPLYFLRRVKLPELSIFTRQLSDLLAAGLPLIRALGVLRQQTESKVFKAVIGDIREYVQDGNTFSSAVARHPKVFSNLFVSMIRSGETGGAMEHVLAGLSEFYESQFELETKVKTAMAYPALLASVGTVTVFVLVTFAIPRIAFMFQDLGQGLPIPTLILVNISNFIRGYWWVILIGVALAVFAISNIVRRKEGKAIFDRFKLSMPVVGSLIRKNEIARFSRTLGTLLNNGVPILESLRVVLDIMGNETLKSDARRALKEVKEGSTLANGLQKGECFPLFVTNMIAIGEEGGMLERSLYKVADAYEREVDKAVRVMTSLLEPFMILVMGLIVGFIVISMLLPIFQISFIVR